MGFAAAIKARMETPSRFLGRASRAEFWSLEIGATLKVFGLCIGLLLLINLVAGPSAVTFGPMTQENMALGVVLLINLSLFAYLMLPVTARRLQDLGKSGRHCYWAYLLLPLAVTCIALTILGLLIGHVDMINFGFGAGLFVLAPSFLCMLQSPWELPFKKGEPGPNPYGFPPR